MKYILRSALVLTISFLYLLTSSSRADMTIQQPIDILGGLNTGNIQATVDPAITMNTIENVFDGNPLTMAGVQNSNNLTITLAFSDTVSFERSKVFFVIRRVDSGDCIF